jgi:hypothetical protein
VDAAAAVAASAGGRPPAGRLALARSCNSTHRLLARGRPPLRSFQTVLFCQPGTEFPIPIRGRLTVPTATPTAAGASRRAATPRAATRAPRPLRVAPRLPRRNPFSSNPPASRCPHIDLVRAQWSAALLLPALSRREEREYSTTLPSASAIDALPPLVFSACGGVMCFLRFFSPGGFWRRGRPPVHGTPTCPIPVSPAVAWMRTSSSQAAPRAIHKSHGLTIAPKTGKRSGSSETIPVPTTTQLKRHPQSHGLTILSLRRCQHVQSMLSSRITFTLGSLATGHKHGVLIVILASGSRGSLSACLVDPAFSGSAPPTERADHQKKKKTEGADEDGGGGQSRCITRCCVHLHW